MNHPFLCSVLIVAMSLSFACATGIAETVDAANVVTTAMYEQVQIPDVLQSMQTICSKKSLNLGQKTFASLQVKGKKQWDSLSDAKKLAFSKQTYELYASKLPSLYKGSADKSCAAVYSSLAYMDYLRDLHVALLESAGLMNDFDETKMNSQELYGVDIKLSILQDAVNALASYDKSSDIRFSMSNETIASTKDTKKAKIHELLTILMKRTVQKKLVDMQKDGLISEADIKQFRDKITLEYVNSCSNFHGSYKVREVYNSQDVLVYQEVDKMKILVNICYNYHILQDIDLLFEKIVTHELAHHIYYQKDKNHNNFESICWSSETVMKPECNTKTAFVTEYSWKKDSLEDYAEHFMHTYLGIVPKSTDVFMKKKTEYFAAYLKK